jgi:TIR domain
MTTATASKSDLRKRLFISYAYEDQVFPKWLARKLAFYGYGVWIDQIEVLGGEFWVKEVDVAIKERSFRVLGLLSRASIGKDNPREERTLPLRL